MKKEANPKLEVGDKIVLYFMEGETSVPPGTKGIVKRVTRDPFEEDAEIYSVEWENGNTLNMLSATDVWKKDKEEIKEQKDDSSWRYLVDNKDILQNFDWRFLEKFLYKVRDSGIVNMFGAAPLLYSGRDHIERYYGEGKEDDESFQEVLEDADEAKDKMVAGVVSYMRRNNKDLSNMNMVNRFAQNFSQKMVGLYITLSGYREGL